MKKFILRVIQGINKLHLVDKCLIIFMAVLLGLSAINLFNAGEAAAATEKINVVMRTSAASIFGYFLSANFGNSICKCEETDGAKPTNNTQIIIATVVGLFCILTLTISLNIIPTGFSLSHDITSTITQFRDFISGCVGFLIGTPTKTENKS